MTITFDSIYTGSISVDFRSGKVTLSADRKVREIALDDLPQPLKIELVKQRLSGDVGWLRYSGDNPEGVVMYCTIRDQEYEELNKMFVEFVKRGTYGDSRRESESSSS